MAYQASLIGAVAQAAKKLSNLQFYALISALALGLSLLLMVILPGFGVSIFRTLLSPLTFCLSTVGLLGIYLYSRYLKFTLARFQKFLLFFVLTIDVFIFLLHGVETQFGIPLKTVLLAFLIYTVPLIFFIFKNPAKDFWRSPISAYMTLFFIVTLFYYLFYNQHAVDILFILNGQYDDLSLTRVSSLFNIILILNASNCFLQTLPDPEKFFDQFNKYYLFTILVFSFLAILFYPLSIMTVVIETKRMCLFFIHPNSYAQYMSMALCFLTGSAFYYLQRNSTKKATLIFLSLPVILVALMTCGSKSSLITSFLVLVGMVILEVIFNNLRFSVFKNPKLMSLLAILSCVAVVIMSQFGVFDSMQQRFGDDSSYSWRFLQWSRLLNNIDPGKVLFGHGHTAALKVTQRYVYNTWNIQHNTLETPYIHNSLLEHCFDYGVFGLIWLIGFFHCLIYNLKGLFSKKIVGAYRSLHIACIAIFFVQMSSLLFNESFYSHPQSLWFFWAFLYFIASIPQYKPSEAILNKQIIYTSLNEDHLK